MLRSLKTICLLAAVTFFCVASTPRAGEATKKNVGVLWYKESGMAQRVYDGFAEQMKAKAPDIQIELKAALPTEEEAGKIYDEWQTTKDAILFLRSNGAQYMGSHPPKIPAFIGASNNPEKLGVIKNMAAPEGNITGVTYYLPIDKRLGVFQQALPSMKRLCLFVMKGHPSSPIEQNGTKKACEAMGIEYHEAVCETTDDLKAAADKYRDTVDAFILGNQSLLIDHANMVSDNSGTTPVFSYSEKPVKNKWALLGLVASDAKLGGMLADSVIEVLVMNKPIKDIPVKTDEQPKVLLCVDKMKQWNVKVPLKILKMADIVK